MLHKANNAQEVGRWNGVVFWATYVVAFFGLATSFTLLVLPMYGFMISTFGALILTACGLFCGQLFSRLLLRVISCALLTVVSIMVLIGVGWFRTSWILFLPLTIPSVCIGAISIKSPYSFLWGFLAALLPTAGLVGLVAIGN